ncbi:MAG: hypothetical protein AAFX93_01595 [Verrucomicrobiota bacterium]
MFLCLFIDNFRLQAVSRRQALPPALPTALTNSSGNICELNHAAYTHHIRVGMSMPKAMSRCAQLKIVNPCLQAEKATQRLVWSNVWQISPKIELTRIGLVTVQLYRMDFETLCRQVEHCLGQLRRQDIFARAGAAPTPDWAELAAITAEAHSFKLKPDKQQMQTLLDHTALNMLPAMNDRTISLLDNWGIRSLGALARLPRNELGERLGTSILSIWDLLHGKTKRLLRFTELEPEFNETFPLETPIENLDAVCFLIRRAADALEQQLIQAGKVARAIEITLNIERRSPYRKRIQLPETTQQADLMERLLRNHLEQIQLRGAICEVTLSLDAVPPLGKQAGLFQHSVRNPWRLAETLDQLAGLVGEERMGSPRPINTHRPDSFTLSSLPTEFSEVDEATFVLPRIGPNLRRCRPAPKAQVQLHARGPAAIRSSIVTGEIQARKGPFCINGDWWTAMPWQLEEWDVEVADKGLFRIARKGRAWLVIGAYD